MSNEREPEHWSIVQDRIVAMLTRRFYPPEAPTEKLIWLKRIEGVEGLWDEKHMEYLELAKRALEETSE